MSDTDLILLGVALILAGCLYLRHRQQAGDCPPEKQWTGHGIDASGISGRVDRVRNDYVAELQSRSRGVSRRKDLLTLSRQVIARLPYIRDHAAGEEGFERAENR
jgi:hypothetical protein